MALKDLLRLNKLLRNILLILFVYCTAFNMSALLAIQLETIKFARMINDESALEKNSLFQLLIVMISAKKIERRCEYCQRMIWHGFLVMKKHSAEYLM